MIRTSYLTSILDNAEFTKIIGWATKTLSRMRLQYDAIAVRGTSGCIMGGALSLRLKKPLIVVRKPNDGSHSCYIVEGPTNANRYIIIDDMICTGDTIKSIVANIAHNLNHNSWPVGIMLYADTTSPYHRISDLFGCWIRSYRTPKIVTKPGNSFDDGIDPKYIMRFVSRKY